MGSYENILADLSPSSDYEKTRSALTNFNAGSVNSNNNRSFDQVNQTSLSNMRKLIDKLAEAGRIERDEYLGIVVDVTEEVDAKSKKIFKKVYVDIPGLQVDLLEHPDQFSSTDVNLLRLEHKAFYPISEKLFESEYPAYNDIVRVKLPPNYFNSFTTNPYDKKYIGIYSKSNTVLPSTDKKAVPAADKALQLEKEKEKSALSNNQAANVDIPPLTPKDPTNKNIASLDYRFQTLVKKFITEARAQGYKVVVVSGSRTVKEQKDIYAQGRTAPGPIVTKVDGGESAHNFGLAIDYAFVNNSGGIFWPNPTDEVWQKVAEIGKSLSLEWGGDWRTFKDKPHLEAPGWRNIRAAWKASNKTDYEIPKQQSQNTAVASSESQTKVKSRTENTSFSTSGTTASIPVNRPKMLLVEFDVDNSTGIRTTNKLGSRKIKIREDIRSDLTIIKEKLNKYNIPLTCNSIDVKLNNTAISYLARVGLEISLNKDSALSKESDLEIDDYYVSPDYNYPIGNGYKLIVYGNVKRNIKYFDEIYIPKKQVLDVYDGRALNTNGPPKIKKIFKNVLNITKIFEDFGYISVLPKQEFFLYSDVEKSNWNIFQKPSKVTIGYSYKELLSSVYYDRGESIWKEPDVKWDGRKFI